MVSNPDSGKARGSDVVPMVRDLGKGKGRDGYLRGLNNVVLKFEDLKLDGESRKSRMIVLEVDSCLAVPRTW
jgi:hypothetical protein